MENKNAAFNDPRVLFAYITVCILWGSTYLAIRVGVSDLPPGLFAGIRFITAGLIMLAFARIRGLKNAPGRRDIVNSAIVGLFLLYGGNGLVVWSEQWLASSLAALLIATVPLFVALIDTVVPGGTPIGWLGWVGLLTGFSGVALLMAPGIELGGTQLAGLIAILLAALLWASGSVFSSRKPTSCSIVYSIAIQFLAAGIALSTTGLFAGELPRFHLTRAGIGAMLYLIFFGSLAGYSAYIYILKAMPPAKASTYAYVNPVVAVLLGYFILKEQVTVITVIAAAIILGGVLLVQMSRTKAPVESPGADKLTTVSKSA
ncbi:Permease of the drug/metabolite transporter (DMT) superfamily [Desulfotomaculum arcticum]|uniref:Permease of the drug/metabolite transporter (DMT) superfamily n=1 Tax=Desulfotruncus arcticus DSM 17038 TaxID=1121424 RepID=A0A1I2PBR1_9FIRM|nr:EamA family transporter [Desulfotruncus arcticus]SFG12943.1 Permease of the drug/metabolite transporter (DMT) superfamily [Desulfotomaculum arcticum] [Desulfotruncus arcticus DSM 17038]